MKISDVLTLTPTAIQQLINDQLKRVPGLDTYVGDVTYVPQGQEPPAGTTHTIEIVSAATKQKLQVAVAGKAPYASVLDLVLAIF